MFDAIYDDGIDIMRIKVHCVRMENTSLEYFVSWMILYAWNIRWYRFRCSSFTISYTYRIFFGYLTFGIFLGYFMSRIFYCLYLLFRLKGFFFFLSFSFITSWNIIFFFLFLCFFKLISLRVHLLFYVFRVIFTLQCQEQTEYSQIFSNLEYIFLKKFLAFRIPLLHSE